MATWRGATPLIVLFIALGVWGARGWWPAGPDGGGGRPGATVRAGATLRAVVARVVDGDTVRVRIGTRRETVRYIGVDTPETKKPGTPVQCYGEAAGRENERLVGGRVVTLRVGAEPRDRYGRLLAFVTRGDGLAVSAALVAGGFARTLTIPPNTAHAASLRALARRARAARRGLWGACR